MHDRNKLTIGRYFLTYLLLVAFPVTLQFSRYFGDYLKLFCDSLSENTLILFVLCCGTAGSLFSFRKLPFPLNVFITTILLYVCIAFIKNSSERSAWINLHPESGLRLQYELLRSLLLLSLVPFVTTLCCNQAKSLGMIKIMSQQICIIHCVIAIVQYIAIKNFTFESLMDLGLYPSNLYKVYNEHGAYPDAIRYPGISQSPLILGHILLLTWPSLIIMDDQTSVRTRSIALDAIRLGLPAMVIFAVALTYSRSAYLALGAQVTIMLLLRKRWKLKGINWFGLFLGVILALLFIPNSSSRLLDVVSTADRSIESRILIWKIIFQFWLERPLFGSGVGSFPYLYESGHIIADTSYNFYNGHIALGNMLVSLGIFFPFLISCFVCYKIKIIDIPPWLLLALFSQMILLATYNPFFSLQFSIIWYWYVGAIFSRMQTSSRLVDIRQSE